MVDAEFEVVSGQRVRPNPHLPPADVSALVSVVLALGVGAIDANATAHSWFGWVEDWLAKSFLAFIFVSILVYGAWLVIITLVRAGKWAIGLILNARPQKVKLPDLHFADELPPAPRRYNYSRIAWQLMMATLWLVLVAFIAAIYLWHPKRSVPRDFIPPLPVPALHPCNPLSQPVATGCRDTASPALVPTIPPLPRPLPTVQPLPDGLSVEMATSPDAPGEESGEAPCHGYSGPGGACYSGPDGGLYAGPGGGRYSGPGGGLYSGPGGGLYQGPGGGMYTGPGGGLYQGPGGGLYTGPGGGSYEGPPSADDPGAYKGPWSPCITGVLGRQWNREHCPPS